MGGVITGFGVIAAVIAAGWLLGTYELLGPGGREVLTRLAFHIATPALLFAMLSEADLGLLASGPLLAMALSTAAVAALYAALAALRRWPAGDSTIGALSACYVNAGNLGIPVAAYVLGDASLAAPVMLFQQLVVGPLALTILDATGDPGGRTAQQPRRSLARRLSGPLRNPMVLGSLLGVAVAATGLRIPDPVREPFELVGAMSVPAMLLAFGISLHGSAAPARGPERVPVLVAVALKTVVQPVLAWAAGAWVLGLGGAELFAAVVLCSLPTAQNIFTYASHYRTGVRLAREAILLSTVLSPLCLVPVAALLG
ncbi:AEC family transporter [Streptomyces xiaopingdaonensis]|uniref:AEC family transporter n=1 Tax=Streptomyces xiaopingdaonensis TaxID=1565415 RepID=UPI00030EF223|nr:AEC family transporter [Streptomyces xiaopingdaonensis]